MSNDLNYTYRGARALVLLHEHYMRQFIKTWRQFDAAGVPLPQTDDPDYQSSRSLLRHVLRAARGYMTWMCSNLQLPDPGIRPAPEVDTVESEASDYLDHLLQRWRIPLAEIPEDRFGEVYKARWGVDYCIESMLEHAVVHPMRHTFQLSELLTKTERS